MSHRIYVVEMILWTPPTLMVLLAEGMTVIHQIALMLSIIVLVSYERWRSWAIYGGELDE